MRHPVALVLTTLAVLGALSLVLSAQAQPYPSQPIKVIVPHSTGGSPDLLARIVAQKLSDSLGQQVLVETRIGAGGMVGTNAIIGATPDGYSLLLADSSAYAITPHMYKNVSFNPLKGLIPIMPAATVPLLLVVHPGLGVSTLKEFLALAKAKPGMFYASSNNGTPHHLAMELLKARAGVNLVHVAYNGSSRAVLALITGEVSVAFLGTNAALPQAKAGKLKILAVSTADRIPLMPDVPSIAEAGIPGFEMNTTFGYFAPLNTPRAILDRLHAELDKAARSADVQQRLSALGLATAPAMTSAQFAEFTHNEYRSFGALVSAIGARAD